MNQLLYDRQARPTHQGLPPLPRDQMIPEMKRDHHAQSRHEQEHGCQKEHVLDQPSDGGE